MSGVVPTRARRTTLMLARPGGARRFAPLLVLATAGFLADTSSARRTMDVVEPNPNTRGANIITADDLAAVLVELPEHLRPAILFSYFTGWRCKSETLAIEWGNVDVVRGVLRIETSKNGEPLTLRYAALPQVASIIEQQRAAADAHQRATGRIVTHVFHRNGRAIKSYRTAWDRACDRAAHGGKGPKQVRELVRPNLVGARVHDLRRSGVTNMESAGVPRSVAMKISGHKTEAMYRRYAISADDQIGRGAGEARRLPQRGAGGILGESSRQWRG